MFFFSASKKAREKKNLRRKTNFFDFGAKNFGAKTKAMTSPMATQRVNPEVAEGAAGSRPGRCEQSPDASRELVDQVESKVDVARDPMAREYVALV